MKALKISFTLLFLFSLNIKAQEIINLYPGAIPNSKESNIKEDEHSGMFSGVTNPTLQVFLPE
ncbi:MAG: hypothetical protein P8Z35_17360, partial [Ignavibacteriaceae bacterium]